MNQENRFEDRYWTVFKYCPLVDGTCNSKCICFTKQPGENMPDGVLDQAYCLRFKLACAIKYKKKDK